MCQAASIHGTHPKFSGFYETVEGESGVRLPWGGKSKEVVLEANLRCKNILKVHEKRSHTTRSPLEAADYAS